MNIMQFTIPGESRKMKFVYTIASYLCKYFMNVTFKSLLNVLQWTSMIMPTIVFITDFTSKFQKS